MRVRQRPARIGGGRYYKIMYPRDHKMVETLVTMLRREAGRVWGPKP